MAVHQALPGSACAALYDMDSLAVHACAVLASQWQGADLLLAGLQHGLMPAPALGAAQLLPRPWLQLLRMLLHAGVPTATLRELTLPPADGCASAPALHEVWPPHRLAGQGPCAQGLWEMQLRQCPSAGHEILLCWPAQPAYEHHT